MDPEICLHMKEPPQNSERSLQITTTTAAAAAWYVLGMLLGHGRAAEHSDLAWSFRLFQPTPDFIRYLCSIPNSPLRLAEDFSVTISRIGAAALTQFTGNSDVILRCFDSPPFVPRPLPCVREQVIGWTYFRKRKRLVSNLEYCLPMRKRCYSLGFDEEHGLTPMLTTMTGEFRNVHSQGNEIPSSSSPPSLYKWSEPKSLTFGTSVFPKLNSGKLAYEVENNECTSGVGCLEEKMCTSDFLLPGRFPHILRTTEAEGMVHSFPQPKIYLLQDTMTNSGESFIGNVDVVNIVDSDTASIIPRLEVDGTEMLQTENKNVVCESLNEDDNSTRMEILLHDFGEWGGGCKEIPSAKSISNEAADTEPKKTAAEPNDVQLDAVTPQKYLLPSQGDLLNQLTRSKSIAIPSKNEKNDKRKTISPTKETYKYLPKRQEQHGRNKDRISNKQKAKGNSDQNSNAKEREAAIGKRKRDHNEHKPFPTFELFTVEEEEGSGGFGTVYRARRKADGVPFAIKCPHANANINYVNNELKMLEQLRGMDCVIKYVGSIKSGNTDCLVLQHVEHDRPETLKKEINITQLQWYAYGLFKALAGLHKQGIVHRDVKPGNFLFSRKFNAGYLIDFNLAMDLSKKHGTVGAYSSKARHNRNNQSPKSHSKPLPSENIKLLNTRIPDAVNKNTGKVSKSVLLPVGLKKRVGKATAITDSSSKNSIKSHGADVSVITSARDVSSTRTSSAERLKEPLPQLVSSRGREELVRMLQEAMHGGSHTSSIAATSKRKRVAAPPADAKRKCFYPTPMPLYSNGLPVGTTGLPDGKADGKGNQDGPCAGTKGFKAPEVLFRSLHQGLKVDIWSAGVTLLYLMTGRTPFFGDTDQNIKAIAKLRGSEELWEVAKIHGHESLFPSDLLDIKYLSPAKLQDWCMRNTRKPDFVEAIPRSLYDLVDKCLTVNPRQRISAEEALRHEFLAPCQEALIKQRMQKKVHNPESSLTTN
ncbi:uncharacterized protein LOC127260611 isoform X2 [Andrographis paniculata]|uniref:uncharacterized protein LOC127260611 isoform X2 n=1 Tax=Andrographis paniculata TaxID=175694 RepID=UPI0021E91195|nr:uncharacterized protein LOC127260611 isoform X2 [Andrographis paniculata]